MKKVALRLFALLALGASAQALAQMPTPLAEWQLAGGRILEPYFVSELPTWEGMAGLPIETVPRYEGAKGTHLIGGPIAEIRYRDVAFASITEGLGVNVVHGKGYRAGVALTYDFGRDEDVDAALNGIGDINPAPELKAFAEYVVAFPAVLRTDLRRAFGGHGGWTADLGGYMPLAGSERFFILAGPSLTWIGADNARRSFGVDATQAARSGYAAYAPGGGLSAVRFGTTATWFFGDSWFADASGAEEWLERAAARSPIIRDRRQEVLSLMLGYQW